MFRLIWLSLYTKYHFFRKKSPEPQVSNSPWTPYFPSVVHTIVIIISVFFFVKHLSSCLDFRHPEGGSPVGFGNRPSVSCPWKYLARMFSKYLFNKYLRAKNPANGTPSIHSNNKSLEIKGKNMRWSKVECSEHHSSLNLKPSFSLAVTEIKEVTVPWCIREPFYSFQNAFITYVVSWLNVFKELIQNSLWFHRNVLKHGDRYITYLSWEIF